MRSEWSGISGFFRSLTNDTRPFASYLLDENWEGYQNVSIPKAQQVPLAGAPLKRQASDDALNKRVPPPATGDRRFFRTWVRIVKA